jgi:hypothetical protein
MLKILKNLDKKSLIYFGIIILASLISFFLIWHFSQMPETKGAIPLPTKPSQDIIKKQLKELETLRSETPSLTEKEIQTQLRELETLQKKTKPLSQEEIQKQLEELNKLR